jgi:hypothetical protein
MLIEHLKKHLDDFEAGREQAKSGLRASSAGKCARAIAYQEHGYKGEPLNWRARLVFRLGDSIEKDLTYILKDYGLTDMQKECSVTIAGTEIKGHIDGIWNGDTVVDFKTTTTFGFKKAAAGDVGSYDRQLHFYMKALGLKRAVLVYYCKEQSDLLEVVVPWNDSIWQEVQDRFTKVIKSTKAALPNREYEANDKGKLPWQCSYCNYVRTCWPEVDLSFDEKGKPVLTPKNEEKTNDPSTSPTRAPARPVGRRPRTKPAA